MLTKLMNEEGMYGIPTTRKLTAECIDFLKNCLQFDPVKRYSIKDLLDSHYLAQSDCLEDSSK
jgi:serine/threonine protein kinase